MIGGTELSAVSLFLAGLLGSVHCIGMCGGITGALTLALPEPVRSRQARLIPYLLAYNAGRILSYTLAGALVGAAGAALAGVFTRELAMSVGRIVSGGFMVLLGLYVAGWWSALIGLERLGARLWRRVEPLGRRFLPPRGPLSALALGLVWGWLPCGLVYSALAFALVSGGAAAGATLMLAFGFGTLPMLLAMGAAARWLTRITRSAWLRQLAGALILVFGLTMLFGAGAHQHAESLPDGDAAVTGHHNH
ncbi:MAG TPA: sulfite exporter TauE/SafE family protein [Acidiferrobacterales bacterium]